MKTSRALLALLILSSPACGDDDPAADPEDGGASCPTMESPSIDMVEVTPTTAAAGDTLSATVHGTDLGFDDHAGHEGGAHAHDEGHDEGMADCPGGHIHVYLNDLMSNPIVMTTAMAFDVPLPDDAPAGEHSLLVRLHNRDHTIYEPQVVEEVTITVE